MKIGLFTDTYFPQVSGVATSIKTAREELEKLGHEVFIFTTTDKGIDVDEDPHIIRLPSIPFFAFKDRRMTYRGSRIALEKAQAEGIDLIHTQTEFSLGLIGIWVANQMKIPVIHTYHTQYEDYTRYIANGLLIRPSMVKYIVRGFLNDVYGVICPSQIVENLLTGYKIKPQTRVIPTGINLSKFQTSGIKEEAIAELKSTLGISSDETVLLSLSRISYEKNIQAVVAAMPEVLAEDAKVKLVIVGDGPYMESLKEQVTNLGLTEQVIFTGMVNPQETALYYKMADFFISASTSETQGLTYLEAIATGTPVIAQSNPYLVTVISEPMFGHLYDSEEDLAAGILEAIRATPAMDETALAAKLNDISAETFGKRLESYYQEVINLNAFRRADSLDSNFPDLPDALTFDESYNLLFAIDDDYVEQFQTTVYSLFVNADRPQLSLYVLQKQGLKKAGDLERFCQKLGIDYHPIIIGEQAFAQAPVSERYPETIYYRLLAHEYLPEDLDRILYLDADILAINDFRPFYHLEITDYMYAAASHVTENGFVDFVNKVRLQNFESETYYNSGVLLMNLPLIRQKVNREAIMTYIADNGYRLFLPDQDIFNALYGHDTFNIPEQIYNYDTRYDSQYQSSSRGQWDLDWVMVNTVFLHFCGRAKPWQKGAAGTYVSLYKHYQTLVKRLDK